MFLASSHSSHAYFAIDLSTVYSIGHDLYITSICLYSALFYFAASLPVRGSEWTDRLTVTSITIVSCASASTRASIRIGSGSRWGGTMTRCCFVWFAIFDVRFAMRGFANWDRGA